MNKRINRLVGVLESFVQWPDVDEWRLGNYYFMSCQDSDGYYGYVSYLGNNVARIVLPPSGVLAAPVVLIRSTGWHTPSTSRTLGAVLRVLKPALRVNIKKGVLTLSDGRIVPDDNWLTV